MRVPRNGYLFNEKPQSEVLDCESDSESDLTDVELETAIDKEQDSQIPHSATISKKNVCTSLLSSAQSSANGMYSIVCMLHRYMGL